jgi:hypothetical protein
MITSGEVEDERDSIVTSIMASLKELELLSIKIMVAVSRRSFVDDTRYECDNHSCNRMSPTGPYSSNEFRTLLSYHIILYHY